MSVSRLINKFMGRGLSITGLPAIIGQKVLPTPTGDGKIAKSQAVLACR